MEYIDVIWHHNHDDQPVRLVSELDIQRYELRKIYFYANGSVGYASEQSNCLDVFLGEVPLPTLDELNSDPQFQGVNINASVFDQLWSQHVPSGI